MNVATQSDVKSVSQRSMACEVWQRGNNITESLDILSRKLASISAMLDSNSVPPASGSATANSPERQGLLIDVHREQGNQFDILGQLHADADRILSMLD